MSVQTGNIIPRESTALFRTLGFVQAGYFVTTGVWSLVHRRSFEAVTGPKHDYWLVQTVGALVTAVGTAIGVTTARGYAGPEMPVLAIGSAVGLAGNGAIHAARRRISPVYLLDVVAEIALVVGWVIVLTRRSPEI